MYFNNIYCARLCSNYTITLHTKIKVDKNNLLLILLNFSGISSVSNMFVSHHRLENKCTL